MYLTASVVVDALDVGYLPEWLNYHKCVGIEHFFIFCPNKDIQLIKSHISQKTLISSFVTIEGVEGETIVKQAKACNSLINLKPSKWVAHIDSDEFLLPLSEKKIPLILKDYEDYGGLAVYWNLFGSSGLEKRPLYQTLAFKSRARSSRWECSWIKTIFQPNKAVKSKSPHELYYKHPYYCVDENFKRVTKQSDYELKSHSKIVLNHYVIRSKEEFEIKQARWEGKYGNAKTHWKDYNEEFDDRICKIAPPIIKFL